MTDEHPAKRGDAAWREQRDEVSRRNAEAHKRAQEEKRSRATAVADSQREELNREADQLRVLNERILKRRGRSESKPGAA